MKRLLPDVIHFLFFVALIIIGLLVYKDYGIPWDESTQTQIGAQNYRYIFKGDPALLSSPNRYYGPVFEIPFLWLSSRSLIPRHLAIFLLFILGLFLFYQLARRLFHNPWWGLLAAGVLAASPRIFADAFYNTKDIPFMVAAIAAILTLVVLSDNLNKNRNGWMICALLVIHAGVSAVLISTRIVGIVIVPLTLFLLLIEILKSPAAWKTRLVVFLGTLVLTAGLTILFWPILWHNPWGEFVNAFLQMSKYPFDRPMLYQGIFISPTDQPWHYIPVWIGITTPLMVLAGFLTSILVVIGYSFNEIRLLISGKSKIPVLKSLDSEKFTWAVVVGWLAIPIAAVYIFHSVLYDGWRHLFFIYPAIVLISLFGLRVLVEWIMHFDLKLNGIRIAAGLFLLAGLAEPIWFMVRYHPHENVYFNAFAGDPSTLRKRFELDYWGLSYKQAVDFILANDPGNDIKIFVANPPGQDYINSGLPLDQKSRLIIMNDPVNADYFVSEFRWHPADYPYPDEYYSISIRGTKIMVVYRLR
jgi:hypothetical protein